ncbi:RAVE protein 1 C terminal-domain-containing protein [Gigaspora rosea]|uniref:RAVE protein 1 C terminal-domain-containing protein n=1 Tax=Gigaspora rosea TaxID=44941 RepID=A0A397U2H4_9GLOM|nr:RAVE protein 1 C terminal-domain-containing protein [Gigaspora rosea]
MSLQQTCSGKTNGYVQSFHSAYWEDVRYLAYGTGGNLVIYNGCLEHIQTTDISKLLRDTKAEPELEANITSVEISELDGKIALTVGTDALVLYPQEINKNVHWNLMKILNHDDPTFCTSWSGDQLLVGGETLTIWEQAISHNQETPVRWSKLWEQRVSSKIVLAQFSPDSMLFASISDNDRLVKIWWNPHNSETKDREYEFSYLPHPRAVTNFTWRKGSSEQNNAVGSNILITMCKDGICRIWASTNPDEPQYLYISTVVDPSQSLVTLQSLEEETCNEDPNLFTSIHWIDSKEFLSALRSSIEVFDGNIDDSICGNGLRKLRNLANDTPDLLYQVQRDGSMVIWGIRNVYCRPRRIPKVLVLLRLAQAFPTSDVEYFYNRTYTFHDNTPTDVLKSSVELTVIAQSPQGRLNKYSIRLVDVFDSFSSNMPIEFKCSWTGHRSDIISMKKTSIDNTFISFARDGETILWKIIVPNVDQSDKRIGPSIAENFPIKMDFRIKLVSVIPLENFVVYDGTRIVVFSHTKDGHFVQIAILEDYEPSFELILLFNFQHVSLPSIIYLAGVSCQENTIFLWKLTYNDSVTTFQQIEFISKVSLQLGFKTTIAVPVEQWTGSNVKSYFSQDRYRPVLATYSSEDGFIRYWQCNLDENTDLRSQMTGKIWTEEVKFFVGEEPKVIKCGPLGKIAVVLQTSNGERIIDVDWLLTSNAELILVIATSRKILIYTRVRKHHFSVRTSWILFSEINVQSNLPLPISAILWGNGGSLIVANGNQLRCYNKWLSHENISEVSSVTGINKPFPTLFHVVDHLNGPLPHHHPTLLLQHILWGKMELVKQMLAHLCKYLKLLIGANKPISRMLPVPFDKSTASKKTRRYSILFGEDSDDDDLQESVLDFTEEAAKFLSEQLKVISLPELTSVEQAQLLALVDTLIQVESQKRSLDENGVRYVLFMRRYHYLNRATFRAPGLSYRDMNWALHSDSQDLLIEYSIAASGGKVLWNDARVHGIFLWLRSNEAARQQMEIIARNHYMQKEERDPTDCSLFYMALRKKKLLLGLWRTANNHKEQAVMLKFLSNNFDEPRWKTAAVKNAYALLGKQRYEYAAAFFLLGDKLKDAANVCLKYLDDFQLAIAICRVYEGDEGSILKSILENHVIPLAVKTGDRWLASMAFWILNQRDRAVKAIMVPLETLHDTSMKQQTSSSTNSMIPTESPDAALIVLYKQLKEKSVQTLRGASEISSETEYCFVLRSIFAYDRMGCPLLALHLVKTWLFASESMSKNPHHILRSRRRTTILDIPLLDNDIRISSGVVNFDNWSWETDADVASSPVSPKSSSKFLFDDDNAKDTANNLFADDSQTKLCSDSPSNGTDMWGWNTYKTNSPSNVSGSYTEKGNLANITLLDDVDFNDYKVALVRRLEQGVFKLSNRLTLANQFESIYITANIGCNNNNLRKFRLV